MKLKVTEIQSRGVDLSPESIGEIKGVLADIQRLEKDIANHMSDIRKLKSEGPESLADVRVGLLTLISNVDKIPKLPAVEEAILKRLHFASMVDRIESITDPEFDTFEWLLGSDAGQRRGARCQQASKVLAHDTSNAEESELRDRARQSFLTWLKTGNEIYHICGRAGSGKSTLMKFLCQYSRLGDSELRQWAGGKKLVFASFFFWGSGDRQQKTLEGLYRSLLYETLKQCPELIKDAFPAFSTTLNTLEAAGEADPFPLAELKNAMRNIMGKQTAQSHRFCFFIDGLDEFEADLYTGHGELARDLLSWASSSHVKICVSSRPYEEFLQRFDPGRRIQLHELTRGDVYRFVFGALAAEPNVVQSSLGLKGIDEVATTVSWRADGIFLWVRLVVRSLVDGIRHRYSLLMLQEKLEKIPQGLELLFDRLFNSIDPTDRERSDKMLLLVASKGPLSAIQFSWIDNLINPDFPYSTPAFALSDKELAYRLETVKCQIAGLSKGLLEMRPLGVKLPNNKKLHPYYEHKVDFFHRTVKDYLDDPDRLQQMHRRLKNRFDLWDAHQRLSLAEFKFAPTTAQDFEPRELWHDAQYKTNLGGSFVDVFYNGPSIPSRLLDECDRVLEYHRRTPYTASGEKRRNKGVIEWGKAISGEADIRSPDTISYMHWLITMPRCHEYVRARVLKSPNNTTLSRDGPGLLMTAAAGFQMAGMSGTIMKARESLAYEFLKVGVSPNARITARSSGSPITTTVWAAFLYFVAEFSVNTTTARPVPDRHKLITELYILVEEFIKAGADCDVHLDLELIRCDDFDPSQYTMGLNDDLDADDVIDVSERHLSLRFEDLILHARPPNQDTLVRHILGYSNGPRVWQGMMEVLSTVLSSWNGGRQDTHMKYRRARISDLKNEMRGYRVKTVYVAGRAHHRDYAVPYY